MRCVHARKQNIKTNETFCCCFFHLVIRVKPIGMESSTSIFLRKTKIPRSHRKQCTKKAEKLVSFSMFDLRSENKKQKKLHIQLLSNVIMAFLDMAKVLMSCDCFIFLRFGFPFMVYCAPPPSPPPPSPIIILNAIEIYITQLNTLARELASARLPFIPYNFICGRKEEEAEQEKERVCEWVAIA